MKSLLMLPKVLPTRDGTPLLTCLLVPPVDPLVRYKSNVVPRSLKAR